MSQRSTFLELCTALAGLFLLASGAHAALPDSVLSALQKDGVSVDSVSVMVQRVDSTKPLISYQADKPLNPASSMKILTTYAGLELLGPAYRWRTEVYTDGTLSNGTLNGNLIIKGHGDPSLMAEDVWRMLNSLRQAGVRDIRGDLVLDNTYFSPIKNDAGSFDNEPYRAYNATPNALAINLKSTSFRLFTQNQQVNIQMTPDLPEIQVINQLKATPSDCGDWKNKLRYEVKPLYEVKPKQATSQTNGANVTFTGEFATTCGERFLDLSVLDNSDYAFDIFRKIWLQLGGTIQGNVRQQATPVNATPLLQQDSLPLADIVRRINKYSNNFMARQLLLTIGAERGAVPATEADGDNVIHLWLASKNMTFPELVLENGSGLSRSERISAQHLSDLLVNAYASPVMPEFMSSLPILAVDGTTMSRLKLSAMQGRAHIKTGSLEGARSIAGYVLDQKGRRWSVVFMANGPSAVATRSAQDALLEWVYAQP
ncbi:MAG TPA: D-alanyl-D-alanine carboxypeptidase/D-alanyl-D-alanine-endopeptidase [Methylophilaceae bacterium]|nr:D-alanyl-D-alanine carboxypeptidase/D-alanyl-D-alanine-endopeptidase [Methylophilaceae bacterium]